MVTEPEGSVLAWRKITPSRLRGCVGVGSIHAPSPWCCQGPPAAPLPASPLCVGSAASSDQSIAFPGQRKQLKPNLLLCPPSSSCPLLHFTQMHSDRYPPGGQNTPAVPRSEVMPPSLGPHAPHQPCPRGCRAGQLLKAKFSAEANWSSASEVSGVAPICTRRGSDRG